MTGRMTLKEAEQICRRHSLPLTIQRRVVLQALVPRVDHPTADEILLEVRNAVPEISRTTVYRVLEALVRVGVARKVCHPGAAARYETLGDRHHHLVCSICGRMTNFEDRRLDRIPMPESGLGGFQVTDFSIQFRGVCASCAKPKGTGKQAATRGSGRTQKPVEK